VVALCVLGATNGVARADGDRKSSPVERARALYDLSATAYEAGRFQEAVDLLRHAYELTPKPVMLFNLARAYEGLGDSVNAIDAYEAYLKAEPKAADRGSIEQRLATLRKEVADRAALEHERDEARLRAEDEGRRASEEKRKADAAEARSKTSAVPWVLVGIGGGGVVTGVVLGAISRARYQSAVDEPYRAPAAASYASAKTYATAANVGLVAGGVVAAGGLTWGLVQWQSTRSSSPGSSRLDLFVAPSSVAFVGRY
jgi:tetratricopeptide (TPR) repeat protein